MTKGTLKAKEWAWCIFKSVITLIALTMDYNMVTDEVSQMGYENSVGVLNKFSKLFYSIDTLTLTSFLLFVFFAVLYVQVSKAEPLARCTRIGIAVMALIATLCAVIGKSFYIYDDIGLLFHGAMQQIKGLVIICGLFMLFSALLKALVMAYSTYCGIKENQGICSEDSGLHSFFGKKYAGAVIGGLIFVVWLPTIIAYYPAVFMGDSEEIIYMAYNYPTDLAGLVVQLKEGIYITNHHPAIYTAYISIILHAVRALGGSWNFGIFVCAMLQGLVTLGTLTYSCMYIARELKNEKAAIGAAMFFAFFPLMPTYALMITKDVFFADLMLLWAILIHKAVSVQTLKGNTAKLLIVSALIAIFRKNGIYVMVITLLIAIIMYRKFWKRWVLAMVLVIAVNALYMAILNGVGIPQGSTRETISVPIQQTARYVKYHDDEVTDEERQAIAAVLDYDRLAVSYTGDTAEPIKALYNENATQSELIEYFIVWFKMFFKHPEEYVASFANEFYGYFYPVVNDGLKIARTSVGSMANAGRDGYFEFSWVYGGFQQNIRDVLTFCNVLWTKIPILNIFMTSALYFWVVLAASFLNIVKNAKRDILPIVVYLALIFTVLMGPCNAIDYERFVYPCMLGMPFLVGLVLNVEKGKGGENGADASISDNPVL